MNHSRIQYLLLPVLLAVVIAAIAASAGPPAQAQTAPIYFVADQVIVSGAQADVNRIVREVSGSNQRLAQLSRLDLSYTAAIPANRLTFPFTPLERQTLVSDLYRITDSSATIAVIVRELNAAANQVGVNVRVDPNYATGKPPALQASNPWSIGGSPLPGDGATPAPDRFHEQWALGPQGISLYLGTPLVRSIPQTGTGVRVGVFDTTPFSTEQAIPETGVLFEKQELAWISPTLTLQAGFLKPAAQFPNQPGDVDIRDHGLFAAGLVHVVAPDSSIELIPVLDNYGRGDLYTLTRAIHDFTRRSLTDAASLTGAVINLSLGVHLPPNPEQYGLLPETIAQVTALETAVQAALGFEISVVAAAGNDSQTDEALPAQIPAAYTGVIGVAGSSYERGRSCFSNRGDLAAPGGNGDAACAPAINPCPGDCRVALIGPVLPSAGNPSGYAYWNGTSFAAPLASGAAALLLEQSQGTLSPPDLAQHLAARTTPAQLPAADTSLGAGIINLRRALFSFELHMPFLTDN